MPQIEMDDIRALGSVPVPAEQVLGLLAENRELKARVAELEAEKAKAVVPFEPRPLEAANERAKGGG